MFSKVISLKCTSAGPSICSVRELQITVVLTILLQVQQLRGPSLDKIRRYAFGEVHTEQKVDKYIAVLRKQQVWRPDSAWKLDRRVANGLGSGTYTCTVSRGVRCTRPASLNKH